MCCYYILPRSGLKHSYVKYLVPEVWLVILVGVVLISFAIMLVVHVLGRSLRMSLCLNSVIFVHAFGLSQSINFGASEAGEELLSESVINDLAYSVLVHWHIRAGMKVLPSLRCLSSNNFIPSKAAAPPISSWENLASFWSLPSLYTCW